MFMYSISTLSAMYEVDRGEYGPMGKPENQEGSDKHYYSRIDANKYIPHGSIFPLSTSYIAESVDMEYMNIVYSVFLLIMDVIAFAVLCGGKY